MHKKISVVALLALLLMLPWQTLAQFNAPSSGGSVAPGEYGDHTEGANMQTSGSVTWYMTWAETGIALALQSPNTSDGIVLYLDIDPLIPATGGTDANGNLTGVNIDSTGFTALPFRADYFIYANASGSAMYRRNGTGGWVSTTGMTVNNLTSPLAREFQVSWSGITGGGTRPASFNWFGYVTTGIGNVYGQVPTVNTGGMIGTNATYDLYYQITNTNDGTSTKPFSQLGLSRGSINITQGGTQTTLINAAFPNPLSVQVRDSSGKVIDDLDIAFTFPGAGASASTASLNPTTTAGGGNASVGASANGTTGTYAVTANLTNTPLATPATFTLTNTNTPPIFSLSLVSGSPQSAVVNTAFSTPLAVKITDQFGTPLSGQSVIFGTPGSGASGIFSTSATVNTDANGIATAPTFTANGIAGSYSVTASSGALTPVSFALTNTDAISTAPASTNNESAPVVVSFPDSEFIVLSADRFLGQVGDTVTFTIAFKNPKAIPLTQVVVNLNLDNRFEIVEAPGAIISGNQLFLQGITLQPGEMRIQTVRVRISGRAAAGDVLRSIASLESPDASIHLSVPVDVQVIPSNLPATGEHADYRWLAIALLVGAVLLRRSWRGLQA